MGVVKLKFMQDDAVVFRSGFDCDRNQNRYRKNITLIRILINVQILAKNIRSNLGSNGLQPSSEVFLRSEKPEHPGNY